MSREIFPNEAPPHGSKTLTGAGSVNDIFTFNVEVVVSVQNDSSGTVWAYYYGNAPTSASQGDVKIVSGAEYITDAKTTWIAIYGAAGLTVNGTADGGLSITGQE